MYVPATRNLSKPEQLKRQLDTALSHLRIRLSIFSDEHPVLIKRVKQVLSYLLAILVGVYLMEFPLCTHPFLDLALPYAALDVFMMAVLFGIIYFLGQRTRGAIVAYWLIALFEGVAQHYVLTFKGAPIIPSDIFALGTAAEVAGGYDYTPDCVIIWAVIVFAISVFVLFKFGHKMKVGGKLVAINLVAALVLGCGAVAAFNHLNVRNLTGIYIYAWHPNYSMASEGTLLCEFVMAQDLIVKAPEGYTTEGAERLMDEAAAKLDKRGVPVQMDAPASGSTTPTKAGKKPTVICIMNETFTDLGIFDEMLDQEAVHLPTYESIAKDSVTAGFSYVSVYGAGTCNTEFEFLTGSTLKFCGNGSYPYEFYDLSSAGNLARYFKNQGYATTAIHPAEASNWSRDIVYPDFGFDRFLSIEDFEDPEMLRRKTTDRETYKKALELIDNSDEPQFIFDVTYMNHSGYSTGLLPLDMMVDVTCNGEQHTNLTEFTSVIRESDRQLAYLIEELEKRDEPVIVVMWGDHGPNFLNDYFYEDDSLTGSARVGEAMKRYTTPYFIWANYDLDAPDIVTTEAGRNSVKGTTYGSTGKAIDDRNDNQSNMSIDFLGMSVVESTGLPLTKYQAFIAAGRDVAPVVNFIGYMDATGTWHNYDEVIDENSTPEAQAAYQFVQDYRKVQYWNLFDQESQSASE